jgi:hypothetical protein
MGVHIDNLRDLGEGFHRRVSNLSADRLFELADMLGVDTGGAPDTDLYDWLRQSIYDELASEGGVGPR